MRFCWQEFRSYSTFKCKHESKRIRAHPCSNAAVVEIKLLMSADERLNISGLPGVWNRKKRVFFCLLLFVNRACLLWDVHLIELERKIKTHEFYGTLVTFKYKGQYKYKLSFFVMLRNIPVVLSVALKLSLWDEVNPGLLDARTLSVMLCILLARFA